MISFAQLLAEPPQHHALLLLMPTRPSAHLTSDEFVQLVQSLTGIKFPASADGFALAKEHPDLFIADRERKILRLEELAPIAELAYFKPILAQRRLFYIERCERMNANVANALLKILEEPLSQCVFVLTSAHLPRVLPTIASRCQKIPLVFEQTEEKTHFTSVFAKEDLNFLEGRIKEFSWEGSLFERSAKIANLKDKQMLLERCEALSKMYTAEQLQGALIYLTAERLKQEPAFLTTARFVRSMLSQWRDVEAFNPSSFLWLTKILLSWSR